MLESLSSRFGKFLEEHVVATVGLFTIGILTTAWTLRAPGIYRRLHAALGDTGILALLFAAGAAAIWCWVGWRAERKKEKTLFERLIPVPGAGYSRDPKNGEFACPRCVSEGRAAYLYQVHDTAMICQACDKPVARQKNKEPISSHHSQRSPSVLFAHDNPAPTPIRRSP